MAQQYSISILLKAVDQATAPIRQIKQQLDGLKSGGMGGMAGEVDRATRSMTAFGRSVEVVKTSIARMRADLANMKIPELQAANQAKRDSYRTQVADAVGLGALVYGLAKPAVQLDQAFTDLRVAMMDSSGGVSAAFDKIKAEAIDLGNKLPGTTADFIGAARALKEQDTPDEVIANGGLRAASYLSVLFKSSAADAAEMVAKAREALGLADNELVNMADLTQRARFGFGIKPEDLKATLSYAAPQMNTMGIKGISDAKTFLAMSGMMASKGLEGSSAGTNFAMMLTKVGEYRTNIESGKKAYEDAVALVEKYGINMKFYDAQGKFMGLENMYKQFLKMSVMNQEEQQIFIHKMFGTEAGRPVQLMMQGGGDGLRKAMQKIESQASLDKRIKEATDSLGAIIDALKGTIENLMAYVGMPILRSLVPVMNALNSLAGGPLATLAEKFSWLIGPIGALAVSLIGLKIGAIALGYLFTFAKGGALTLAGLLQKFGLFGKGGLSSKIAEASGLAGVQRVYVVNMPGSGFGGLPGIGDLGKGAKGGLGEAVKDAAKGGLGGRMKALLGGVAGAGVLGMAGRLAKPIGMAMDVYDFGSSALQGDAKGMGSSAGSLLGGMGGAWGGAAAGAAIGSIVPFVGTAIGGVIGAALGGWLGSSGGSALGAEIAENLANKPTITGSGGGATTRAQELAAWARGEKPAQKIDGKMEVTFSGLPPGVAANVTSSSGDLNVLAKSGFNTATAFG